MPVSRRQSTLGLLALIAAAPRAWAKDAPPPADDDDDDLAFPNVFFSPHGQPFRARASAPYPVVDWFKQADKNGDGKIDHAEFLADAEAFFKTVDRNGDGVLSRHEVSLYEHNIAPEILGGRVKVSAGAARLWLAQMDRPAPIDPGGGGDGGQDPANEKEQLDVSGQGASPFNYFDEPEPLLAADLHLDGIIRRSDFLKLAGDHFSALDFDRLGYLTLANLPKTAMQKLVEKNRRGRRRPA